MNKTPKCYVSVPDLLPYKQPEPREMLREDSVSLCVAFNLPYKNVMVF